MRLLLAVAAAAAGDEAQGEYCSGRVDEVQPCNVQSCTVRNCTTVDAAWGPWTAWGSCSCSSQTRERTRPVATHAACSGKQISGAQSEAEPCVPEETDTCDVPGQPVPCSVSDWSAWSECKCGAPQVFRTRVVSDAIHCGTPCDAPLKETAPCDQQQFSACNPVQDCTYAEWGEWSKCPVTCGGAQQARERTIVHPSQNGGAPCAEPLAETQPCGTTCCAGTEPVDCKWGKWGEWSGCSAECEGGTRSRSRGIDQFARNGGKGCAGGNMQEFEPCNPQSCNPKVPVDGTWGEWSEYSTCTVECGGGYQARSRKVAVQARHGGKPLTGQFDEYRRCNEQACTPEDAVDCEFSEWTPWTECSCKCNGKRATSRSILKHGANGGKVCEGGLAKWEACNKPGEVKNNTACEAEKPKKPCAFTEWGAWSECSASCAGGTQSRSRDAEKGRDMEEACHGTTAEVRACNGMPCFLVEGEAVDCVWGEWTQWGDCTKTCGGGQKSSYRHVETGAKYAGKPCDASGSMRVTACSTESCEPTGYCTWSEWSAWSNCSLPCNGGERTRSKTLSTTNVAPKDYLDSYTLVQLQGEVSRLHAQLGLRVGLTGCLLVVLLTLALRRRGPLGPVETELLSQSERAAAE